MATPARLYCLLARNSRAAVIFRRGPSKQVLLIKWDRGRDTFEEGQWFKGRIYERRCDLSPSGDKLLYFAASFKEPHHAWTAISRPPWLTALVIWPKGDCWNGGGMFVKEDQIFLNHPPSQLETTPESRIGPIGIVETAPWRGEDDTVYPAIAARDGWELVEEGKYFGYEGDPPETWRKPNPRSGATLTWKIASLWKKEPGVYEMHYAVTPGDDGETIELGTMDWADWDRNGDLLFARSGKIFRTRVMATGIAEPRELADFNDRKFEAIVSPRKARVWA